MKADAHPGLAQQAEQAGLRTALRWTRSGDAFVASRCASPLRAAERAAETLASPPAEPAGPVRARQASDARAAAEVDLPFDQRHAAARSAVLAAPSAATLAAQLPAAARGGAEPELPFPAGLAARPADRSGSELARSVTQAIAAKAPDCAAQRAAQLDAQEPVQPALLRPSPRMRLA